jgi:two-component system, OmpR family, manganese sensing response regulator
MRVSPRILYVDDDKDACEMIGVLLALYNKNFDVVTFVSAKKALNMIGDPGLDLYIFDYSMPELSGAELCSFIRQSDLKTPIVIYTARARPADREAALNAGANAYLIKPTDLDILGETVERLLNRRLAPFSVRV